ncbi:MAG: hypothetical protein M1511_15845 [Deltaproteobacteria bacterium]|nr:hypothetical protein [Deltaproteobacteria bacterium]
MIVEQDYFRAMIAYLPAANRGHAGANFMLGLILFYGLSVNRNRTEALKFFRRSGNQGELFLEFLLKGLEEEGPIVYLTDDLNCSKNRSWVEKIREFLGSHTPAATSNKASSF